MSRKSYFELLKDPRWQRRRLEILSSSDFRCENCQSHEKTLHVHHKLYRKGANPWEYGDRELQALCEDCHAAEHQLREELATVMALMAPYDLDRLLGYAQGMMLDSGDLAPVKPRSFEHAEGMSDVVSGNAPEEVYAHLLQGSEISATTLESLRQARRDRRAKQ